jgi:hypothetical protein
LPKKKLHLHDAEKVALKQALAKLLEKLLVFKVSAIYKHIQK